MNAISKPDVLIEPVEDVKTEIKPTTTKSKSLWGWLDRMTEANYKAWVQAGRPEIY